jgi:hypothetical protein
VFTRPHHKLDFLQLWQLNRNYLSKTSPLTWSCALLPCLILFLSYPFEVGVSTDLYIHQDNNSSLNLELAGYDFCLFYIFFFPSRHVYALFFLDMYKHPCKTYQYLFSSGNIGVHISHHLFIYIIESILFITETIIDNISLWHYRWWSAHGISISPAYQPFSCDYSYGSVSRQYILDLQWIFLFLRGGVGWGIFFFTREVKLSFYWKK